MSKYSEPDVIDISSDEEDELPRWLDELLDEKYDGNFYDIVEVDQIVNLAEKPKDDDDDCVILDGDPDKAVVKDDKGGGEDDSDELLVVGEKGQVACRDFPHSRHLCVSFPFSTTSHQKHCSLCHCYVCDSPAPCMYWGDGVSLSDHCHATDTVELWKIQRKSIKGKKMEGKPFDATLQMPSPPVRNTAPLPFQVPVPLHAQSSLTNILRPCAAPSVGTPYAPGQSHHQQAAVTGPSHHPQAAGTGLRHHPQAAGTGLRYHPQHHPQAAVSGLRHHQQPALTGSSHHRQPAAISSHGPRLGQHITRSQSSVPGTQGVQRGRHGADALTRSIMQSHKNFKRVGNTGSGLISSGINCSQYMASNQKMRSLPQKSHCLPGASQRSQQRAITSHSTNDTLVTSQQRSQCMPLTSQSSHLPPISSPISQNMPTSISSHTQIISVTSEDSTRGIIAGVDYELGVSDNNDKDAAHSIFAGVGSELGVSDNNDKDVATFQPYIVSSLPPSVDGQVPSQIDSSQGMVSYSDLGSNATLSYPLDLDDIWLDGSVGGNFSSGLAPFEVSFHL